MLVVLLAAGVALLVALAYLYLLIDFWLAAGDDAESVERWETARRAVADGRRR